MSGTGRCHNYGHGILNFMSCAVLIPPQIRDRVHVVTRRPTRPAPDVEKSLELPGMVRQIIVVEFGNFIFARLIYAMEPFPGDSTEPVVIVKYREWMAARLFDTLTSRGTTARLVA
jgi:hypothetical protein